MRFYNDMVNAGFSDDIATFIGDSYITAIWYILAAGGTAEDIINIYGNGAHDGTSGNSSSSANGSGGSGAGGEDNYNYGTASNLAEAEADYAQRKQENEQERGNQDPHKQQRIN